MHEMRDVSLSLAKPAEPGLPQYLFLCGVPRSGTTAACQLLNSHPHIVMGVERYKYLYSNASADGLDRSLFERGRFFEFKDSDTNVLRKGAMAGVYDKMETKFDQALYIGDKLPRI